MTLKMGLRGVPTSILLRARVYCISSPILNTVEPHMRGQIGTQHFVLLREVVLFKRLIFYLQLTIYPRQINIHNK